MSGTQPSFVEEVVPEINFDCADGRPLPLIRVSNRRFEVVAETEALLAQLPGHAALCAVMGKLRTGKSFLLNKLIGAQAGQGFVVSDSVNACTKGLWLWSKPVYNDQRDLNILFMDTEGLDSLDRDADVDAKLFALAMLLSSFFIYNTVGSIDQPAINGLALVARLAHTVVASEGDEALNEYALASYAPRLLWVLRDFTLELRDGSGKKTSPPLYLESALSTMSGSDSQAARGASAEQRVRAAVLGFFRRRDCLALVRPVFNEAEVRALPRLADEQLRPEFLAQVNLIRSKIWQSCSAKVIAGTPLTGARLVAFARQLVSAFNQGAVPMLGSAWQALLEAEAESARQAALSLHRQFLTTHEQSLASLRRKALPAHGAALAAFYRAVSGADALAEQHQAAVAQLAAALDSQEGQILEAAQQASQARDEEAVARLYSGVLRKPNLLCEGGQRFGDLINEEVYELVIRQSSGDAATSLARATAKLTATLFSVLAAAFEGDAEARRNTMKHEAEKVKERRAADENLLQQEEAQLRVVQAQVSKLEQQLQEISGSGRADERELLEKKERVQAKRKEVREQISSLGDTLAENRLKIEKQEKKKRTFCG